MTRGGSIGDALPAVLASGPMTRNLAAAPAAGPQPEHAATVLERLDGRSLVIVGLMGAGKTTIGRRLAVALGLPFVDADAEIERAAGLTVGELFDRFGEAQFRDGERRVIARVLGGAQAVVATGGGAVTDAATRRLIAERAVSLWLRCPVASLVRRVAGRTHRPLLQGVEIEATLERLLGERARFYAQAQLVLECGDDGADVTTARALAQLAAWGEPRRVRVPLAAAPYEVVIGDGLLGRAGGLLAARSGARRCVVVTDAHVAALHLPALLGGMEAAGIACVPVVVAAGEASKRLETFGAVAEQVLAAGIDRRTPVVALGGGVVGDLAGFVAATLMRGLPLVQVPTTLLAQVDSSVGGKTGINAAAGKNLIGAFHQPMLVLADTGVLATLPARERRAGYAEIVKAGLIGDRDLFAWCERHGPAALAGDRERLAEAVERAVAFKAAVVVEDEREEKREGGRALLNLGHTFGHALEAELGYDGRLLHGEGVAVGCMLAFALSRRLGWCEAGDVERVRAHLGRVGLPVSVSELAGPLSADRLLGWMTRDKKVTDGALTFILARGIGAAFTEASVPPEAVRTLLLDDGCVA